MSTLLAFNATMPYYGLFMQVSLVFRWLPTLGHLPVGWQLVSISPINGLIVKVSSLL